MKSDLLTWIEINGSALLANVQQFRHLLARNVQLMPVIKSNAYGHGMAEVASLLAKSPVVDKLAVVSLREALAVREQGIEVPLFVLSYADWFSEQGHQAIDLGIRKGIEFPVYSFRVLDLLAVRAAHCKKMVKIHVKIDTGTSRVGFFAHELPDILQRVGKHKQLQLTGLWTPLGRAENTDDSFNALQLNAFSRLISLCKKQGFTAIQYHASASAALMWQKNPDCNLGRLGISLYGLWPSPKIHDWMRRHVPNFTLRPVMSWKTRLIQIKDIPQGSFVSYDGTYQVRRLTRLAILPIGYFEGFDRGLSNKAHVLVRGSKAPVLGRVCMNLTMVDVTDVAGVTEGDEAVIIGSQGEDHISAEMMAEWAGTINYEVVSRIHPSIPRFVI